jgi:hypothetical protein
MGKTTDEDMFMDKTTLEGSLGGAIDEQVEMLKVTEYLKADDAAAANIDFKTPLCAYVCMAIEEICREVRRASSLSVAPELLSVHAPWPSCPNSIHSRPALSCKPHTTLHMRRESGSQVAIRRQTGGR